MAVRGRRGDTVLLANPLSGRQDQGQTLGRAQFDQLGPFDGIWLSLDTSATPPATPVGCGGA
jgi:hypothetical protein